MTFKKKLLYALMGFSLLAMVGQTVSSNLNERSKKETKARLAEQRQSWEFQNTEKLTATAQTKAIEREPQTKTPTPKTALPLSEDAQLALNSLQQTYLSEVNTKAIRAEQEEWEAKQSLLETKKPKRNAVVIPVKPMATQSSYKAISSIEQVIVKSIFFNDRRVVAWVEFEGQLIPIKEQSLFLDSVVESITKNSVVFNDGGRLVTRYMSASKKAIPKEEGTNEQ